jgi:Replication-relaxation
MSAEAVSYRGVELPETASEVVASLVQHRLLSTPQVRALHFPDNRVRWTQSVLARLRDAGLVGCVQPPRSGRRLWFATEGGARMAREAHALEATPRPLEAREVAGQLQAHTLAVNEAGICFLRAARERGDEFGPLSWRHEVAHPLARGRGRRRRTLIADAVLTYLRGEGGRVALEQRFLELDRATLSVDRLVAELAGYAELYGATGRDGEPAWAAYYPRFPAVHCVLGGAARPALERRRNSVIALLRSNPRIARTPEVQVSICLLEDLKEHGPFAPIFTGLGDPGKAVDWLGKAPRAKRRAG